MKTSYPVRQGLLDQYGTRLHLQLYLPSLLFMHLDSNQAKLLSAPCKFLAYLPLFGLASLQNRLLSTHAIHQENSYPSQRLTFTATSTQGSSAPTGQAWSLPPSPILCLSSQSLSCVNDFFLSPVFSVKCKFHVVKDCVSL